MERTKLKVAKRAVDPFIEPANSIYTKAIVPPKPFAVASMHRAAMYNTYCSVSLPSDPNIWSNENDYILKMLKSAGQKTATIAMTTSFCRRATNDTRLRVCSLDAFSTVVAEMRALAATSFEKSWPRLLETSLMMFFHESYLDEVEIHDPVYKSLKQRFPSFALLGTWTTVPWAKIPKSMLHKLYDVVSGIAIVRQRCETPCYQDMDQDDSPSCIPCQETRSMICALHARLDMWVVELETRCPHLTGIATATDKREPRNRLPYMNSDEITNMTQFWRARLALHAMLWRLLQKPADVCHIGISQDLESHDDAYIQATKAILRNADFILGPHTGSRNRETYGDLGVLASCFCNRRGGLEDLCRRSNSLRAAIEESFDADIFATPISEASRRNFWS
ncbi:hypothetical protein PWT90_06935 [Aphanocladium album]|nr:hypothetical protein PWT90_06935 [Aphanocladium album]